MSGGKSNYFVQNWKVCIFVLIRSNHAQIVVTYEVQFQFEQYFQGQESSLTYLSLFFLPEARHMSCVQEEPQWGRKRHSFLIRSFLPKHWSSHTGEMVLLKHTHTRPPVSSELSVLTQDYLSLSAFFVYSFFCSSLHAGVFLLWFVYVCSLTPSVSVVSLCLSDVFDLLQSSPHRISPSLPFSEWTNKQCRMRVGSGTCCCCSSTHSPQPTFRWYSVRFPRDELYSPPLVVQCEFSLGWGAVSLRFMNVALLPQVFCCSRIPFVQEIMNFCLSLLFDSNCGVYISQTYQCPSV